MAQRHRMIQSGLQSGQNLHLGMRVTSRAQHDFIKQILFNKVGAGKSSQKTAVFETFDGLHVYILVAAGGFVHVALGFGEGWRIEDYHVI